MAYVNVETFKECFPSIYREKIPDEEHFYTIYCSVTSHSFMGDVNIDEYRISRVLVGFLEDRILEKELPNTWEALNR